MTTTSTQRDMTVHAGTFDEQAMTWTMGDVPGYPGTARFYPVLTLSDGRHIAVSPFGWSILEGDGQCTADVTEEAWRLSLDTDARTRKA